MVPIDEDKLNDVLRETAERYDKDFANCFGMTHITSEGGGWTIPELDPLQIFREPEAKRYLMTKGLSNLKVRNSSAPSQTTERLMQIDKLGKIARYFVPESFWLEAKIHQNGSFLVGKTSDPLIIDGSVLSPTLDAIEQAVFIEQERLYFRAILSRVLKGLETGARVVSPLLVLVGGSQAKIITQLISVALGGNHNKFSGHRRPHNLEVAKNIHWTIDPGQLGSPKGKDLLVQAENFRTETFISLALRRTQSFEIPSFVFLTVHSPLEEGILRKLPSPENWETMGMIVLYTQDDSAIPELSLDLWSTISTEIPGYRDRLKKESLEMVDLYYSPIASVERFEIVRPVFEFLFDLYFKEGSSTRTTKTLLEIANDLREASKQVTKVLDRDLDLHAALKLLSRYRPQEVRQLNNQQWEFTKP